MNDFLIRYLPKENCGLLTMVEEEESGIWQRLMTSALQFDMNAVRNTNEIKLAWFQMLSLLREFLPLQRTLSFRIRTDDSSKNLLLRFVEEYKLTRRVLDNNVTTISENEVVSRLNSLGFTEKQRELRSFQKRDIAKLLSVPNGANFSVPGAGKTTVTLGLHLLSCKETDKLLVVCPKSAFGAWNTIISECIEPSDSWTYNKGRFINLSGLEEGQIVNKFTHDEHYFFTNYEHFVSKRDVFSYILATYSIHLVLDESHRMKAGELSQRGSSLLAIANLPKRKDILSGTPMPQSQFDLQAQLDFLYPGSSLGLRIERGESPSTVITGLYTRTTKAELGLPPVNRRFIHVPMSQGQSALYAIIRNDALSQLSALRTQSGFNIVRARRSVMRLLQLASNPLLAIRGISDDINLPNNGLLRAIEENPVSPKMLQTCELVEANARLGRKTVVWTIFTQNILDLEMLLADLNPVSIYGATPTGESSDETTREGRLKRFHEDDTCMVLIANPAAAGEGISLHMVCHDAIYLDRSYVSTHYLQSIDRIHRLGLPPETITNISIIQAAPPPGLGSIDFSVSRRLGSKIRALEKLLDDRDLHEIALDEETAAEPIDYNFEFDDLEDLILELEGKVPFDENTAI